jgi:hypothetical protein
LHQGVENNANKNEEFKLGAARDDQMTYALRFLQTIKSQININILVKNNVGDNKQNCKNTENDPCNNFLFDIFLLLLFSEDVPN